jgi:hypothetical protein
MAETRRKTVKGFPRINNCRVHPEAFSTLNNIAGPRAMGAAIEDLCNMWNAVQGKKQAGSAKPEMQQSALSSQHSA